MLQEYPGPKLRELRKRARLTQMQVVELTGVSEATICYLERGDRRPQSRTLEKLLNLYAIRIQYWKNLDKVFKEDSHAGNLSPQTTIRPGMPGIAAVRTAPKPGDERKIPVPHGLPRIQG
jgi:transcriptional regulator with XRE-family HTH domain